MKDGQLTLVELYEVSLECLSNAEAFIDDARSLTERGSYGHATALLVLAEEEIGKGLFWRMRMMGIRVPGKLLRHHRAKQIAKFSVYDFMAVLILDLLEGLKENVFSEPDEEKRQTKMKAFAAETKRRWEETDPEAFRLWFDREIETLASLDELKQRGLYVDVLEDGTLLSPLDFGEREALEHLRRVEERYRRFQRLVGHPSEVTEEKLEETKRRWKEMGADLERRLEGLWHSLG